jgi:hypothetical protein
MTDGTENTTEAGAGADGGQGGKERYKVAGDRVVAKLKELLHEGNIRHIVIKNDEGKTLIEIPVTIGVAGALLVPVWAAVGAVAAVVTNCTIEVERQDRDGEETEDEG